MLYRLLNVFTIAVLLTIASISWANTPLQLKNHPLTKQDYIGHESDVSHEIKSDLPAVGSRNPHSLDEVIISESFESYNIGQLPPGWTQVDVDGGTCPFPSINRESEWQVFGGQGFPGRNASVRFVGNFYNDAALPNDDWLILPQQSLGGTITLSYWVSSQDASFLENYEVRVSTTGNQPANFTHLIANVTNTPNAWTQRTHDLSAYAGAPFYIAFHYISVDEFVIKIDDIVLEAGQAAPSGDISGTVRNANTNAAIAGATVEILGLGTSATTDAQGRYFLANVPPATYSLNFSHPLYSSATETNVMVMVDDTAIVDVLLNPLPLEFHNYMSTGGPVAIPDVDSASKSLQIADDYLINDIDITVNISHTWVGDLTVSIEAPNGDRVLLSNRNGGNGDGYIDTRFDDEAATPITAGTAPFTGSFSPEGDLSILDAFSCQGLWTLHAVDNAAQDEGQITNFTVHVTTETAAVDEHGNPIPVSIKFNGNYPNPFNPTTEFNFTLDRTAQVELKLYNMVGQEVATLVSGQQSAGDHHVYFNGSGLSSGLYFAHFSAAGYTATSKVVLMK